MPAWSNGAPVAAASKFPVQPMRSIQVSQCRITVSAFRCCQSAQ